jgi:hypothetical protein
LVAQPADEASAAKALGRLEADYARCIHVRRRTSGHLWQARPRWPPKTGHRWPPENRPIEG